MSATKYIWPLLLLLVWACTDVVPPSPDPETPVKLNTQQNTFEAGDSIVLKFDTASLTHALLMIHTAWGTTGIAPEEEGDDLSFLLPQNLSQKSGTVDWKLLGKNQILAMGSLSILPGKQESNTMETYLGPTSIFANTEDHAIIVALPQDQWGNPLPDGLEVQLNQTYANTQQSMKMETKNMIAYKRVGYAQKTGDLFLGASHASQRSKEFTLNVLPWKATAFRIECQRLHPYADGNQMATLTTSIIKDAHQNLVADGTLVQFYIDNGSGKEMITYGHTINGVALAKILHPSEASQWTIRAQVPGASQSNSLQLAFKPAVEDFPLLYDAHSATVTVGPILSYMGQWIPDGMAIDLDILKEGQPVGHMGTTSKNGMGTLQLPRTFDPSKQLLEVSVAGLKKQVETVHENQ